MWKSQTQVAGLWLCVCVARGHCVSRRCGTTSGSPTRSAVGVGSVPAPSTRLRQRCHDVTFVHSLPFSSKDFFLHWKIIFVHKGHTRGVPVAHQPFWGQPRGCDADGGTERQQQGRKHRGSHDGFPPSGCWEPWSQNGKQFKFTAVESYT